MKDRFRKLREALGYSQDELAVVLDLKKNLESTNTNISKYERGISKPSAEVFEKLSQKLKVNINWLLTGEGEMFLPDAPVPVPRDDPATRGDVGDLRGDLRAGLADISRKLDTLAQLPGEANQKKEPVPDNVVYIEDYIRSRTARQMNHFTDKDMTKMGYPLGAGEVFIEDYSNESDWILGTVTESVPDDAEYVTTVKGDSMEPTIMDGAKVFWKSIPFDQIRNGDLAVHFNSDRSEFKLRRIHFVKKGEQRIAVLVADNPKVLDTTIVDENIHIYGVVVYGKNKK